MNEMVSGAGVPYLTFAFSIQLLTRYCESL
jgi:hypothetical protein